MSIPSVVSETVSAPRAHPALSSPLLSLLIYLPLCAGLLLTSMLPLGRWYGADATIFRAAFVIHLALLLATVAIGARFWSLLAREEKGTGSVLGAVALVMLFLLIVEASHPILARDALTHHLAVPKWWLQQGSVVPIAWHEWSYYPMLLQLGFAALLSFGLEALTPYYHLLYLLLLAVDLTLLGFLVSKERRTAMLAGVLPLLVPVCIGLGTTPLVDLGIAFFSLHALLCIQVYLDDSRRTSALFLLGISLGLAMSVKYNGLLVTPLLSVLLFLALLRQRVSLGRFPLLVLLLLCGVCVAYGPWLLQNYMATGNPIYPQYGKLFGSVVASAPSTGAALSPLAHRVVMYGESWWEIALTPLRMLFNGRDGDPRAFDGVLSPIFLLALLPLRSRKRTAFLSLCALFVACYFLGALYSTSWRIRYLAPIFGPALLLTALGLGQLYARYRLLWYGALALQLLQAFVYTGGLLVRSEAVRYLTGIEDKESYLSRRLVEYPLVRYVNETLPDTARVYLLYTGNQFYYFDRSVISGGYNSERLLLSLLSGVANGGELARAFRAAGITHILLHKGRAQRALPGVLSDSQKLVWNEFIGGYLREQHHHGLYGVWELQ